MDDILSYLPWAAPTITALAGLIQSLGSRRSISRRLDAVERTLQLLLMHDTHLPLSARVDAGKRYIDLGGNGSQTAYFHKLEEKYKERVAQDMEERK